MSVKTATILTRIEPDVKEAADNLFERIGTTTSGAINIFLRKALESGGFPFEVRVNQPNVPNLDTMTQPEVRAMLDRSEKEIVEGKHRPAKEVFERLNREYGIGDEAI